MQNIGHYWKAIIAFIAPGALTIGSAVLENSAGGEAITSGEWITAAVISVVTAAGVYAKSNDRAAPAGPEPVDHGIQLP